MSEWPTEASMKVLLTIYERGNMYTYQVSLFISAP